MLPTLLKIRSPNHQKCSQNDSRGAPAERSWNLPLGTGKKTSILTRFWSLLGSPGAPWGPLAGAIFALGPPWGALEEPKEPILSHLGRVPFWALILDPKKNLKKLNFEGA